MAMANQKRSFEQIISELPNGLTIHSEFTPLNFENLNFNSINESNKREKKSIINRDRKKKFRGITIRASPFRETTKNANNTIKFKVEEEEIEVNRTKLAKRAPDFEARFQKGSYKISNISSQVFQAMLDFLTCEKFDQKEIKKNATGLLSASNKFGLKRLKTLCEKFLIPSLSSDTAVDLLNLANDFNAQVLKSAAIQFLKNHPKILKSDKFKELFETSSGLAYELYKSIAAVDAKTETRKPSASDEKGEMIILSESFPRRSKRSKISRAKFVSQLPSNSGFGR